MPSINTGLNRLGDMLDTSLADAKLAMFTIDLLFARSPKLQRNCGCITVWRNASYATLAQVNPLQYHDPNFAEMIREATEEHNEEQISNEFFAQDEGKWTEYALRRLKELYDGPCRQSVRLRIGAPALEVNKVYSATEVSAAIANGEEIARIVRDVTALFDGGFAFDPLTRTAHRGPSRLGR